MNFVSDLNSNNKQNLWNLFYFQININQYNMLEIADLRSEIP